MLLGSEDVKRYQRQKLTLSLLGTALFVVYSASWLFLGEVPWLRWTEHPWLGLFAYAGTFGLLFQLLSLPLEFYSDYVLEHRYELSNQTPWRWLSQVLKGWCVGGVLGGVILGGLYACLWYTTWWWLWVWLGWVAFAVVLAQLFPVLLLPIFYKSKHLEDQELCAQLAQLAQGTEIVIEGIYSLDISKDTKAANAMLTGMGTTRRVYLSDTLLEAFSPSEIRVVFAHELGHHVRKHMWKTLALSAMFAGVHVWILAILLEGSTVLDWRFAVLAFPKVALALTVIGIVIRPIHNAMSRRFERQCDRDALRLTRDPSAYHSAFCRLAEMNLADPNPHPVVEWYFHDHPAISKRLALADEYRVPGPSPAAGSAQPGCP